ncbi:MAG TPA: VTT domain-containing protein [Dehalococcoidia bacterium]|jgi:membrane protein DedA with SNARE-associated domain|nr:VTT domain-containing protein [Dehalococcoidia bacterium]
MSKIISKEKQAGAEKRNWLKKRLIPLLILLLIIAITVGIHLVYGRHPERLIELEDYVYGGAFLISLIGNATIILPGAVLVILSEISVVLYPVTGPVGPIIVGLVGGAGAAIGEITGYMAGYSGRGIVERSKMYNRVEGWMRRWGAMTIFIFSVVPFFFDLAGIAAGALRFPFWKFFLLCWLGRTLLYVVFVLLAALGFKTLLP